MRKGPISKVLHICAAGLLLGGCVMAEKYEQEKARGLNFQRLLAQEEKRTAELDGELKKVRRQLTEMEAKNRELGAELQSVREQYSRAKEEAMALQETASLTKEAGEAMNKGASDVDLDDPLKDLGLDEPILSSGNGGTAIPVPSRSARVLAQV